MKITELQVFKHLNNAQKLGRMKGSAIRNNNIMKPIYPIHSEEYMPNRNLAIIQEKGLNGSPSSTIGLKKSVQMTPLKESPSKQQKIVKAVSVIVDKQRRYACLSARSGTPTMAKQFSQTPHKTERKDSENSGRVVKTVERYINFEQDDEPEAKLTLTGFQAKARSVASASKTRMTKTEEEIIILKLQGTNYKITTKCTHSDERPVKTLDKSELFEKRANIYLTQDHPEVTKILKESGEIPNANEFKQIMAKIHIEKDKQMVQAQFQSKNLKIRHRKLNAHSASISVRKKSAKTIENARENVKVNVINLIEQNQITNKRSCHQVFNKYFKKQDEFPQQTQRQLRPARPQECFVKVELVEELKQIQREIKLRKNVNQKLSKPQQKHQKYTTNFIEQKLKKRKSLIEHYTFKKATNTKIKGQTVAIEDFHVDGWQMDQKEMLSS